VLPVLALILRTVRVTERIRIVSLSQMSLQNFTPRNFCLGSFASFCSRPRHVRLSSETHREGEPAILELAQRAPRPRMRFQFREETLSVAIGPAMTSDHLQCTPDSCRPTRRYG